jgi:hypothetical protein
MKEGIKKNIYYELRTNNVLVEEKTQYTQYTFGCYQIQSYWDHLYICKLNPSNGVFVFMSLPDTDWHEDEPKNNAYEIYIAAKNKANGKEYTDPYKNMPIHKVIKDSVDRFDKILKLSAADIFPYDMPKQQYTKTIAEMRKILVQGIKQYRTKTK